MTLIGALVLLGCWIPATGFLIFHAMTDWRSRAAGQAVMVMAAVVFIVMTLALVRITLKIDLPDEIRFLAYTLIAIALWWKLVTILRYRYGDQASRPTSRINPGSRLADHEETR